MKKGNIILIPFPFTDLSGKKLSPAVILRATDSDLTVSFITTHLKWKENTDLELLPTNLNGIKMPSLIRLSKIASIDRSLAIGKLGELQHNEITELNNKLKIIFQLE